MSVLAGSILGACTKPVGPNSGTGIPRQVYDTVPIYTGPVDSVGTLTKGYIHNTEGLITANSRLRTLCIVYKQCKPTQE